MIPHHFKNWFRKFLLALLLLPTLIWAESPGIRTIAVETHTDEAVYLLDVDIRFQFGNEIIEAIETALPAALSGCGKDRTDRDLIPFAFASHPAVAAVHRRSSGQRQLPMTI